MSRAYRSVYEEYGVTDAPQRVKERDRQHKLELYNKLISFWEHGHIPDNAELDHWLEIVAKSDLFGARADRMSADGRSLVMDTRRLLRTLRSVLAAKNSDEVVQRWFYHTFLAMRTAAKDRDLRRVADKLVTAEAEKRPELGDVWTIVRLLAFDSQFRGLFAKIADILRGVYGSVKAEAVEGLEEKDRGRADSGIALTQASPALREPAAIKGKGIDVMGISEAGPSRRPSAGEPADRSMLTHRLSRASHASRANRASFPGRAAFTDSGCFDNGSVESEAHIAELSLEERYGDSAVRRWSRKGKGKAIVALVETTPKKERDANELIGELKALVSSIRDNGTYYRTFQVLLDFFSSWLSSARGQVGGIAETNIFLDANMREGMAELRTIAERFGGEHSLDPLVDSIRSLAKCAADDESLENYVRRSSEYIQTLISSRKYLHSPKSAQRGVELIMRGRALVREKYRPYTEEILNQYGEYSDALAGDELTQKVADLFSTLADTALYDKSGNLTLKRHLLEDVKSTVLPAIVDEVEFLPVPPIEVHDSTWDVWVDNVILTTRHIIPDVVELKVTNDLYWNPRGNRDDIGAHIFDVNMSNIYANVRDVSFRYKHRKFPRISDSGLAHVVIGGRGICIFSELLTPTRSRFEEETAEEMFPKRRVRCKIDKLSVRISQAKHNVMYQVLRPLLEMQLRKAMEAAVEKHVSEVLSALDRQLYSAKKHLAPDTTAKLRQGTWSLAKSMRKSSQKHKI